MKSASDTSRVRFCTAMRSAAPLLFTRLSAHCAANVERAALGQTTVPFCSVIIRKAFGVAGAANTQPGHHHYRFAWPSGDWGSLPIEGGIEVAYKADLAESDNPEQLLADIKARLNKVRSPFRSAEFFEIEDIIEPARTRETLCQWANLAAEALQPGPSRFGYRP